MKLLETGIARGVISFFSLCYRKQPSRLFESREIETSDTSSSKCLLILEKNKNSLVSTLQVSLYFPS